MRWIHLRVGEADFYKDHPDAHFLAHLHEKADLLRSVCDALGMLLTVHDLVSVADFSAADGIHFGEGYHDLHRVREVLGEKAIIGTDWNPDMLAGPGALLPDYVNIPLDEVMLPIDAAAGIWMQMHSGIPCYAAVGDTDLLALPGKGFYGVEISERIFRSGHAVEEVRIIVNIPF